MMMNAVLQISHYEQLVDDTLKYIKDIILMILDLRHVKCIDVILITHINSFSFALFAEMINLIIYLKIHVHI